MAIGVFAVWLSSLVSYKVQPDVKVARMRLYRSGEIPSARAQARSSSRVSFLEISA